MTEEEAVAGWSSREKTTFDLLRTAYRKLRQEVGASVYITRKMLIEAYGGNSIGTASKFMATIEALEGDQPRRGRASSSASQEQQGSSQSSPHPVAVQNSLNALQAAAEGVSRAIAVERSRETEEATARYHRLLDEQRAVADADFQAAEARIVDLEAAAAGAGAEAFDAELQVEHLRASLAKAEAARDEALAAVQQVAQRLEVELAHANTARTQIEALHDQIATQSEETARLRMDANWAREATDLGHRLRAENAALVERTTALMGEIERLQELLRQADLRHERERGQMRAEHERALVDERQRWSDHESRFGWLDAPVSRTNEGERS